MRAFFTCRTPAEDILIFREHFIPVQIRIKTTILELDVVANTELEVFPAIWKSFFSSSQTIILEIQFLSKTFSHWTFPIFLWGYTAK